MPLWRIYSSPGTFDPTQKAALVSSIVPMYTPAGLPAFYVVIVFHDIPSDSFFVSGQPQKNFVRIVIDHLAVHLPDPQRRAGLLKRIDAVLEPHIAARGDLNWEYHINESARDLWKTQGINPPPHDSEEEKIWAREDKPLAWENGELKTKL